MPTGYTADVANGKVVDFKEFAMRCARAMVVCIDMRDEPLDAPIPEEFQPSNHYAEKTEKAKQELAELKAMTKKQRKEYIDNAKKREKAELEKYLQEEITENARYEDMMKKVEAWVPPSSDHQYFKEFMKSQLETSMKTGDYYQRCLKDLEKKIDYDTEFQDILDSAERDVKYYQKQHQEELDRAAEKNKWIKQLRESLR